jgi:hypothetical protein
MTKSRAECGKVQDNTKLLVTTEEEVFQE